MLNTESDDENTMQKLTAAELFDNMFTDIKNEVNEETVTGKVLQNTVTDARLKLVRSQKASSKFKYIGEWKAGRAPWTPLNTELIRLEDEYEVVEAAYKKLLPHCGESKTAFLRACPEFARHGVLESIAVTNDNLQERWSSLRDTMKREDPNGCLILQPFIPATSSMVLAPQQYATIGQDHDGITAGHGYKLYFHLNPDDTSMTNAMSNIGHKPNTYELEFVYNEDKETFKVKKKAMGESYITQIRGAPPHPIREAPFSYLVNGKEVTATTDGMIPQGHVEVKEVWEANGLEEVAWLEENITKEKCPEGFVISEPKGSLLSHICAHARAHSIPYIVGKVEVGQRWTEGSATWVALDPKQNIEPKPYNPCTEELIKAFNAGLEHSRTHWQRQHGWFAHFFHQWVGMGTNGTESAYLAGAFCGWMVKAILAVSFGEMRHAKGVKRNALVDLWPTLTATMGVENWEDLTKKKSASGNRQHYYAMMERMNVDFNEMRLALQWCTAQFRTGWQQNYGGRAWADCAMRGVRLSESIIAFRKSPSEDTLTDLIEAVNSAKNAEHNNGFLYGKFLSKSAFDFSDTKTLTNAQDESTIVGLFPHSPLGINSMFRTYELAREFKEGKMNEKCNVPTADWLTIFSFLKGKGATYWRHEFIANSKEVPTALREAAIECGPSMLHHSNKYSSSENFVPCGIVECGKCKENDVIVMQLKFDKDIAGLLLTSAYPEVFLAQGKEKSATISYATAQLLRDKQYDQVTPKMWVDAWEGLNNQDPVFPMLSELLSKFVKNQMGDNHEWTQDVMKMIKESE